jgi:hypothetical protein
MYATPPNSCGAPYQWQWMYVPVCVPAPCAPAPCAPSTVVPFELSVDGETPSLDALVGGLSSVHPTLEYLVEDDAAAPAVTVTITANGTTITWSESAIDPGYHVKNDLPDIAPGSIVQLEAVDATARLRWCERLCC